MGSNWCTDLRQDEPTLCPLLREHLCLLQNVLRSQQLLVRWIAELFKRVFHQDAQLSLHALFERPVDGCVGTNLLNKNSGEISQGFISHDLFCTVVDSECVIRS